MHRPAVARPSILTSALALTLALALTACATPPTATPEPMPPTALPEPATVEAPTEVPVIIVTATFTPTETAAPTVPPTVPPVPPTAAVPVAAQPTAAAPAAPAAPTIAPPTANSGAPVVEFFPDNGQFQIDKDQLCIAVNWRTENVTDVRLEVGGGKATAVAASGRQADICFGEDKLKLRLIYKLKDGREESQSIEVTRKD